MGASSPMGSCSSLAIRRSAGEVMGSSCSVDHSGSAKGSDCLCWCGVVRWNRGGKQRTTVRDVTASLLTGRYSGGNVELRPLLSDRDRELVMRTPSWGRTRSNKPQGISRNAFLFGGFVGGSPHISPRAPIPGSLISHAVTFSQHSLHPPRTQGKLSCSRNLVSFLSL